MKSIPFCGTASRLSAALLVGACAAGPADDDMVEDLPYLAIIEELRIGSVDDPEVGFSNISDIVAGDDGLLYVLERAEREVRVYDEDVLVRRFGRSGSGPGEFEMPTELGLLGDTVWVTDFRAQRLSLFRRDGTYIGGYKVPPITIEPRPGINVMLRVSGLAHDGTLTTSWGVLIPENPPTDTPPPASSRSPA